MNEYNHAAAALRYLLECELATYGRLCTLRNTSKNELERHENIIRGMFRNAADELRLAQSPLVAAWRTCPRVDEILSWGLVPDASCARYFERERGALHSVSRKP